MAHVYRVDQSGGPHRHVHSEDMVVAREVLTTLAIPASLLCNLQALISHTYQSITV
jgi:hypothetical protein